MLFCLSTLTIKIERNGMVKVYRIFGLSEAYIRLEIYLHIIHSVSRAKPKRQT